jgi:hypothetical protein
MSEKDLSMSMYINTPKEILFIVGAGASVDHSKSVACPPLGKDLAEKIRQKIPEFIMAEKQSGKLCGNDFEEWLENNAYEPEVYTDVLWCLSKYFCKFNEVPHDSLYLKVLRRITKELLSKSIFVSLNYEALLELAIHKSGYKAYCGTGEFDSFNNQWKSNQEIISIVKPHGSCTYRTKFGEGVFGSAVAVKRIAICDKTSNISLGPTYLVDPKVVYAEMGKIENSLPSIVSAYNPEKSSSFNREFIESSRQFLLNTVANCRKVVMIGLNFRATDIYINSVIRNALESGAILGFVGDKTAFNNYLGLSSKSNQHYKYLAETFRSSIDSITEFLL